MDKVIEEIGEQRSAHIEEYIKKFLKDTGLTIEDVFLVEEHNGTTWTWRLARKKKKTYFSGLSKQTFDPKQV